MNDRATLQAELLLLCGKVRDDTLTPGDAARLDELLQADDKAKQLYVRYMSVASLLESRGMGQRVTREAPAPAEAIDHDLFAELLELEEQAEAELVELAKPIHLRIAAQKTPWQIGGALRWVAQQPAAWSGAAAVFMIAVVLVFVFRGGETSQPIADQPDPSGEQTTEPGPVGPAQNIVATLTAEHNAVWKQPGGDHRPGALVQGTQLSAGQRLTLTQGFAEITTHRGAIAIIQAPATIELINNDNALQLHSGKLVGICETPSSKGFTVRTPHLDITDLGTRFGVDATDTAATSVHVIDGLVQVAQRSQINGQVVTRQVTKEQALVATADGFSTTAFQPERFASALRNPGQPIAVPGEVAWYDHPMRELKESEDLQVYTEKTGLILKEDLAIDIDGEGNRPTTREPDALTIPAGTAVDVYLLNLDTPGHEERIGGFTVRFDRPILGVIGMGERLDQTDALFAPGTPKRNGGSARGAIEDLINPDLISADGRTLQLTLRVASTTDQLRVLVAAENNN